MISMKVVSAPGAAAGYFAKDNYYTREQNEAQSEWAGTLAREQGLSGRVNADTFRELLSGHIGGQELGRHVKDAEGHARREHRPGYDITFSAPKSVSILAEVFGRTEVRQAHDQAVRTTLEFIERDFVKARYTEHGITQSARTGKAIFALFHHNTSRSLDPQTHTHAVLLNITQRSDGQFRAVDLGEFFKAKPRHYLDAIYKTELAKNLTELGYQVERSSNGRYASNNFEIAGFTRTQLEAFSHRAKAIEDKLAEHGTSREQSSAKHREVAFTLTRERKRQREHTGIVEGWTERAKTMGIDPVRMRPERARTQAGRTKPDQLLHNRNAREHVLFAVRHLTEREVLHSREDILQTAGEHARGNVGMRDLEAAFVALARETRSVPGANGKSKDEMLLKQAKDGRWMLTRAYESERYTVRTVEHESGAVLPLATAEQVRAAIERLEHASGDPAKTGPAATPLKFSAEQRRAAFLVATAPSRYSHIQGDAGSGKTTVVRVIRDTAEAEGYVVRGMAVTGNAALELEKGGGVKSQTLARFLLDERERTKMARRFDAIDRGNHPKAREVWIVDESSMVGQAEFGRLVHYAEEAQARVVFVGDRRQLPAVPAGKPWEIVQAYGSAKGRPKAELIENIRQRDPAELHAVDQVKRKEYGSALKSLFDLGKVVVDVSPVELVSRLAKEWHAQAKTGERPLVGVVTHRARLAVNDAIRAERKKAGEIRGPELSTSILENTQWTRAQIRSVVSYADDTGSLVVRFRRDYRSLGVNRGDVGRILAVDEAKGRVQLNVEKRASPQAERAVIDWTPTRQGEVEVYRTSERTMAKGDSILITREHPVLANRSVWDVAAMNAVTREVTVRQASTKSNPRIETFQLDAMPHWDHAYARTLHSLQGTTAERFMLYAEANNRFGVGGKVSDAVLEQIFGARGFYVGITRQREALTIYTNDREVLAASIQKEREKTSALEGMGEVPGKERQNHEPQMPSHSRVRASGEDSRAHLDRRTTAEPTIESTRTQDQQRRLQVRPRSR